MHIRCPHCHNPVEVVGDDFSDVNCPSCGSHFSLISGDTTATHQHDGARTIVLVACGYSTGIWGADDCVANGSIVDSSQETKSG